MALAHKYRLGKRDFKSLFLPNVSSGMHIRVTFGKNNLTWSRFSIVISNKTVPKAVKRNRIRRIISDTITQNTEKISGGYDILVNVRTAKDVSDSEIRAEVIIVLKRAKLLAL